VVREREGVVNTLAFWEADVIKRGYHLFR